VSAADARHQLEEHVEGSWDEDILRVPKVILMAENFSAQTYTTVAWLSSLSASLDIEMHTVNAFLLPEGAEQKSCLVFRRLYPAVDPSSRVLTPGLGATVADSVTSKIAEKKRRTRSTYLLFDSNLIPEGSTIELRLQAWINPEIAAAVDEWIAADPNRGKARWVHDRDKPLIWAASSGAEQQTPTSLAKQIILQATGVSQEAIPGPDVWLYKGESLAALAKKCDQ
jgi:hypothetical protein